MEIIDWNNCHTKEQLREIDVISKADYENRLKADMVAMLTEVLDNVEEVRTAPSVLNDETADSICAGIADDLRGKIDKLRGEEDENNN